MHSRNRRSLCSFTTRNFRNLNDKNEFVTAFVTEICYNEHMKKGTTLLAGPRGGKQPLFTQPRTMGLRAAVSAYTRRHSLAAGSHRRLIRPRFKRRDVQNVHDRPGMIRRRGSRRQDKRETGIERTDRSDGTPSHAGRSGMCRTMSPSRPTGILHPKLNMIRKGRVK